MPEPYLAICMQPPIHQARNRKDVEESIARVADMIGQMVFLQRRRIKNRGVGDIRLVVFPEYCFSDWRGIAYDRIDAMDVAVEIPGPEVERLARAAKENDIFIAAQALERTADFPGHYLNAMFIFDPNGRLIYKRHKLRHALLTLYTSPNDVLDRYLEVFGKGLSVGQTVFPVVETEIGVLGMTVCHEITTPEIARQLTANGAEVILRPTSEPDLYGWHHFDRARAMENSVYMVVANAGYGVEDTTISDCGHSRIIGYRGELIVESQLPDTIIWGLIDVERLRAAKGRSRLPLWAPAVFDYHQQPSLPANMFRAGRPAREEMETEYVRLGLVPDPRRRRESPG